MILMKDIVKEPSSILKQKSVDVTLPLSDEDAKTLNSMIEYIFNSIDPEISEKYGLRPAVGIAAPQIGILKKIIVINAYDEDGKEHFYAIVNPKLMSYSDELTYLQGGEGCLSVEREAKGLIHRHKRVTVKGYFLEDGQLVNKTIKLKGYIAIVFQHEYDHLFGTLFVDRINPINPFEVPANSTPVVFKDFEDEEE